MRAVLDANVLVSAIIGRGPPAEILAAWRAGTFELILSEKLLEEVLQTLARPKLAARISRDEALAFAELLRRQATLAADSPSPPRRSSDPGDDYLVALAESERALLVSGDRHLLDLSHEFPIRSPRQFLTTLE